MKRPYKRAFVLADGCGLASALVPRSTNEVLVIGSRITIIRPLNLGVAKLSVGEEGTVDFIDLSSGLTEVLMDKHHWGLSEWHNHIWLEPFGTDDIIDCFACYSCDVRLLKAS